MANGLEQRSDRMSAPDDIASYVPFDRVTGDDAEDDRAIRELLARAENFIAAQSWNSRPTERYLAFGIGGVIAVCLFRMTPPVFGTDEYIWVVAGDMPPAYFVTDCAMNAHDALLTYCELMDAWVVAVEAGRSLDEVFPVAAEPTAEHAAMLRSRLAHIRERFVPMLSRGDSRPRQPCWTRHPNDNQSERLSS